MENSPALKALIRKNAHLFWYTKDSEKENLPLPTIVEFFLNFANEEDVKQLFKVVGIDTVAKTFYNQLNISERSANNYDALAKNYFSLYFNQYAPTHFR